MGRMAELAYDQQQQENESGLDLYEAWHFAETSSQRKTKMTEKAKRELTPVGEAKWAHLHTPKAPFTDESGRPKGDPKYQIDVCFSKDDPAWATWASDVMAKLKELPVQVDKKTGEEMKKQTPIKRELDADDNPTGRFYVTFKTSDKFKPGVFDRHGKVIPEDVLIGNGSKVRVAYLGNVYSAFGGGVNFYLNAVQVLDLVEYQSQSAAGYGFDVDETPSAQPSSNDAFADVPF